MINLADLPPAYQAQALQKYKGLLPQKQPKQNKYKAQKTWRWGLCFDSIKEANFFDMLRLRHRAGQISGYLFHGKLVLAEGDGQDQRAMCYEPDFIVLYPDGHYEIIDTKGMQTKQFKDKMKIAREKYPQVAIALE